MAPRPNLPVGFGFTAKFTTLAGRFAEANDRVEEAIGEAIQEATRDKSNLWIGTLHGKGGERLQVSVDLQFKYVLVGLDPDPEFETWMRELTRDMKPEE